jgi:hypothetical protein
MYTLSDLSMRRSLGHLWRCVRHDSDEGGLNTLQPPGEERPIYHGFYPHGLTVEMTTTDTPSPKQLYAWQLFWAHLLADLKTTGATAGKAH